MSLPRALTLHSSMLINYFLTLITLVVQTLITNWVDIHYISTFPSHMWPQFPTIHNRFIFSLFEYMLFRITRGAPGAQCNTNIKMKSRAIVDGSITSNSREYFAVR